MAATSLAEIVRSLTPEEQEAVRRFIEYLKQRGGAVGSPSQFLEAADEFMTEHADLLRQLAR